MSSETAAPPIAPKPPISRLARGMLIGLTLFFFAVSLGQMIYLHSRIDADTGPAIGALLDEQIALRGEDAGLPLLEMRARVVLEERTLERRYHQANALLMSRIWVSYLSFVTGMILCLVGAAFVLAQVRGPAAEVALNGGAVGGSVKSASPGLVLAVLGTTLIALSITTNHQIAVNDGAVYLDVDLSGGAGTHDSAQVNAEDDSADTPAEEAPPEGESKAVPGKRKAKIDDDDAAAREYERLMDEE